MAENEEPRGRSRAESNRSSAHRSESHVERFIRLNIFSVLAIFGSLLGLVLGVSLKYSIFLDHSYWNPRRLHYLRLPGEIFLSMLRIMTLPLSISCIVAGIGSMDLKTFGFVFWRAIVYIVVTTLSAAFIGALVAIIMHPGHVEDLPIPRICFTKEPNDKLTIENATCTETNHPCHFINYKEDIWTDAAQAKVEFGGTKISGPFCGKSFPLENCELPFELFLDLVEEFFPPNIINSFTHKLRRRTNLGIPDSIGDADEDCFKYVVLPEPKKPIAEFNVQVDRLPGANYAGVYVLSIFIAISALRNEDAGRPLLNVFTGLSQCTLKMANWVIWFSPIGICSIVAENILSQTSIWHIASSRAHFLWTTLLALFIYTYICLPFIYWLFVRKSPFKFFKRLLAVQGFGLGVATSEGTIPLIMDTLEEVCHLDPRIVRFMLPVAGQTNLDGSAITTIVAVIYTMQLCGVDIDLCKFFTLIFMTFASVSVSNAVYVPGFYRRRLAPVFHAMDMPVHFYVYTYDILWFIRHFRTVTNVLTHCVGIAVVDRLCARQLEIMRLEEESRVAALMARLQSEFQWEQEDPIVMNEATVESEGNLNIPPNSNPVVTKKKYKKPGKLVPVHGPHALSSRRFRQLPTKRKSTGNHSENAEKIVLPPLQFTFRVSSFHGSQTHSQPHSPVSTRIPTPSNQSPKPSFAKKKSSAKDEKLPSIDLKSRSREISVSSVKKLSDFVRNWIKPKNSKKKSRSRSHVSINVEPPKSDSSVGYPSSPSDFDERSRASGSNGKKGSFSRRRNQPPKGSRSRKRGKSRRSSSSSDGIGSPIRHF